MTGLPFQNYKLLRDYLNTASAPTPIPEPIAPEPPAPPQLSPDEELDAAIRVLKSYGFKLIQDPYTHKYIFEEV